MNKLNHKLHLLPLLCALLSSVLLLTSCASSSTDQEPVTKQSYYFDTIVQLTIYDMHDMSHDNADAAINGAFKLCSSYEQLLSKTIEGSDIWNINHAKGSPVTVDPETVEVVEKGIEYSDLTNGRFDMTIGKAEDLWDFHSDDPKVPAKDALADAVQHVDYHAIQVDASHNTITLSDPEAEIDLGGIAKGYIADKVCDYLRQQRVTSAIISLGGNIETIGGKPGEEQRSAIGSLFDHRSEEEQDAARKAAQTNFRIGIETPFSDRKEVSGVVDITDGTMVTSGVYERYFTVDGKDYHHILDVNTGYPIDNDVLGVTIQGAAGHSVDCDALSTTCLILGSSEGSKLIESLKGYEAAFILRDGSMVTTSGMKVAPAK